MTLGRPDPKYVAPAWRHRPRSDMIRNRAGIRPQPMIQPREQFHGAVAQLGERVVRIDEVVGSIPIRSTTIKSPAYAGLFSFTQRIASASAMNNAATPLGSLAINGSERWQAIEPSR